VPSSQTSCATPTRSASLYNSTERWRLTPARMAKRLSPRGTWDEAEHITWLSDRLAERIVRGGARIVIHAPPRHAKSTLVSKWTPAWALSHFPTWPILFASYEARFARSWGRKVREVCLSNPGLGVRVAGGRLSSVAAWNTVEGGGMYCAGIGGPFTGMGAKLLIVDDPIKNAKEAYSSTVSEAHWEWWQTTAYTRLEPGASAIVMMTRWTPKDLAGRLLAQAEEGGEPWEYWRLPAIAHEGDPMGRAPGEALWPGRYSVADLQRIFTGIDARTRAALYDGAPLRGVGKMFQRGWFGIVKGYPANASFVRFWDFAGTEAKDGSDPDWTVGVLLALYNGIFYVLDVRRIRASPLDVEKLIAQTAALDGEDVPIRAEVEGGSQGKHTMDHYARHVLLGYDFMGEPVTRAKELRAGPVSAAAEAGNLKLLEGRWNKEYLDELEQFVTPGVHDDQVDATSGAVAFLAENTRVMEPDEDRAGRRRGARPVRDTDEDDDEDDENQDESAVDKAFSAYGLPRKGSRR
jgi:predicted phage terminase large subunit-like protein